MNLLTRKMHMNIQFCLPQVKNSCYKRRNALFPLCAGNKPSKIFELGQRNFPRASPRPCTGYFIIFFPGSSELEIIWTRFTLNQLEEIGIQEMSLARRNKPLGSIVLLQHEGGGVFCLYPLTVCPSSLHTGEAVCVSARTHVHGTDRPGLLGRQALPCNIHRNNCPHSINKTKQAVFPSFHI